MTNPDDQRKPITQGHTEPGKNPSKRQRFERSRYRINGNSFSYSLDINFSMLAGVVCRRPSVAVMSDGKARYVWSRLKHIDQGYRKRGIYLPIRFEGQLSQWAFDNLDLDDHIVVTGRLWMGETIKKGARIFFTWMQVERATCGMPVQIDQNPDFLRVRLDLWNRMCMQIGAEAQDLRVPETARRTVKFEDVDPYHLDAEVECVPLQDPDAEETP